MMKATEVIRRDHEAVKGLFIKFKDASETERESMEPEIFDALTKHERMEDNYFYPALRDHGVPETGIFSEINGEQKKLEAEVLGARALPGDRSERILAMMDTVLAHAEKEEHEIFPEAEKAMSDEELTELGRTMEPESAANT